MSCRSSSQRVERLSSQSQGVAQETYATTEVLAVLGSQCDLASWDATTAEVLLMIMGRPWELPIFNLVAIVRGA